MCFFFLFGITPREKRIGEEIQFCRNDERDTTHEVIERRMVFSLFFVPLFPVSRKEIIKRCTSCGRESIQGPIP